MIQKQFSTLILITYHPLPGKTEIKNIVRKLNYIKMDGESAPSPRWGAQTADREGFTSRSLKYVHIPPINLKITVFRQSFVLY